MDNTEVQNRITKLNECILNFNNVPDENINRLVKLCGKTLGATFASYNNLQKNLLCTLGLWNTPPDFKPEKKPEGHICYDIIQMNNKKPVVFTDLYKSKYFLSDPIVKTYNLKTYIGIAVRCGKEPVGSLSVVYQKDFKPNKEDLEFMSLIASAISIEEDRKRNVIEILDKESVYKTFFDNSPSGIIIENAKGDVIDCNLAVCNIFGYSKEEFRKKNVKDLVPKVFIEEVKENVKNVLSGKTLDHIVTNVRKDGSYCFLALRENKILLPDGNDGILVISNDITKRREIEIALRQSEEKYRSLVENITEVIFSVDLEGKFTYISPLIKEFGQFDVEEIIGTPFTDYVYPDDLQGLVSSFQKALSGILVPYEFRAFDKKGNIKYVRSTSKLQFENNVPIGLHGIMIDITEKKKFEEELKKAKEEAESAANIKSQFLATISHEIRTPINGVIGMTELLLNTLLNDEQKEYVDTIKNSGEILLSLINDILDFSKFETEKIVLESHPCNIRKSVEELINSFSTQAKEKNLEIKIFIDKNVPESIITDTARIRQILANLVSNALKYTNEGEVNVSVKCISIVKGNVELELSIKDTGIGISQSSLSQLFQPFTQLDPSNTRKYGGTGLGLIISKHLVEMMKGKIRVESKLGEGSNFIFTIIGKKSNENLKIDLKKNSLNFNLGKEIPLNILLVEDNLINQKVTVRLLNKLGYTIDVTENGVKALEAVKKKKYDIIFMDIQMPEMDGFETTKQILKMFPKMNCPKIIAMTAAVMKGDREKCLNAGMVDYIPKPVLPEVVQAAIEKWGI